MYDLILRGGTVVDGTGRPAFSADVGLVGDRIAFVGRDGAQAGHVIDVTGNVVAPGFVDIHSHSDFTLFEDRAATTIVRQGVTTEVVGNCGQTYAPLTARNRAAMAERSRGWQPAVAITWSSVGEYLDLVRAGNGVNSCFLVGHGTLRAATVGPDDRPSSAGELADMCAIVDDALRSGARGMSTGLEFMPGRAASAAELAALAEVVGRHGGILASHIRNRDRRFEEAVDEMLEVSGRGGVPLQLSHLMVKPGHRPGAWERVVESMEDANARGQDVAADMIPYDTGPGLATALLPSWALEGGPRATLERLRTPEHRARIRGDHDRYWLFVAAGEWDRLALAFSASHPEWIGERFDVLAGKTSLAPIDVLLHILEDEGEGMDRVMLNGRLFSEEHVRACMTHPRFALSSDGWRGTRGGGPGEVANHPSCWGWAARILGHYVRDERVLTLEEAVRKMTSLPAARLRLADRGLVREGLYADLAVFDPRTVDTKASFRRPAVPPTGIAHVFVNGTPVVVNGAPTGALPGRVL